jgi:hypothetical protein
MKHAILVILTFAGACAGPSGQGYALSDAVRAYTEGVKWERFDAAAAVIPPRERDLFLDERDQLAKDLRITETEILRLTQRGRRAEVHVKLTWYRDSEGVVRTSVAAQRWERQGKAWRLVDEHRARGDEMPGLREDPEVAARHENARPGEE